MPLVLANFWAVLAILAGLLLVKSALVLGASRLFGATPGNAMRSGLWLCAGGEFGLVLLSLIQQSGVAPPSVVQSVLAALVISLLLTPIIRKARSPPRSERDMGFGCLLGRVGRRDSQPASRW